MGGASLTQGQHVLHTGGVTDHLWDWLLMGLAVDGAGHWSG